MIFLLRLIGILVAVASLGVMLWKQGAFYVLGGAGVLVGILFLLSSFIIQKTWERRGNMLQRDWEARMKFNPEYEELRKKRREFNERQAAKKQQDSQ